MSRFSMVRQGSALASARTGVVCGIALGAMIWTGCGNKPSLSVQETKQARDTSCSQPDAAASDAVWRDYATRCLQPQDAQSKCYVAFDAMVWRAGEVNKILLSLPSNQTVLDLDLAEQDATEQSKKKRPDLWRHHPSNLPDSWQAFSPSQPKTTNAVVYVMPKIAKSLGITSLVGPLEPKFPECSPLMGKLPTVQLSPTSITLTGSDGSQHAVPVHSASSLRQLSFPNLTVKLPDDGEQWPAPITKISVAGSISVEGSNGKGSVDLLNEDFVFRPQEVDLTSDPAGLTLTCNGLGRFAGAKSASCQP